MDRAQGNLTTGTYIGVCNLNSNDIVARVEVKGDGNHRALGGNNRNDEESKLYIESLGNDRYRTRSKKHGVGFRASAYAEGALVDQETDFCLVILRETETQGEYFVSFVEEPSWYVCSMGYGSGYKMSADPNQGRWSFFEVDN